MKGIQIPGGKEYEFAGYADIKRIKSQKQKNAKGGLLPVIARTDCDVRNVSTGKVTKVGSHNSSQDSSVEKGMEYLVELSQTKEPYRNDYIKAFQIAVKSAREERNAEVKRIIEKSNIFDKTKSYILKRLKLR